MNCFQNCIFVLTATADVEALIESVRCDLLVSDKGGTCVSADTISDILKAQGFKVKSLIVDLKFGNKTSTFENVCNYLKDNTEVIDFDASLLYGLSFAQLSTKGLDIVYQFYKEHHCCPEKFYHSLSCVGPSPSGTLAVRSV